MSPLAAVAFMVWGGITVILLGAVVTLYLKMVSAQVFADMEHERAEVAASQAKIVTEYFNSLMARPGVAVFTDEQIGNLAQKINLHLTEAKQWKM